MKSKDKKIEIRYLTGNVDGIKETRNPRSSVFAYTIPRFLIGGAKDIARLNNPALYYLIYEDEDELASIYIGQSRGGLDRLLEHNRSKGADVWNKAILFLSDDEHFNPTVILGLEKVAIEKAKAANKYTILNNQAPKVNITDWMQGDVDHYYEEIEFLLSTMGYDFTTVLEDKNIEIFSTNRRGVIARAVYHGEKFEVLAGSEIDLSIGCNLERYNALREELTKSGDLKKKDDKFILGKNIEFKTPSGASDFVLGGSTNGWTEWKNKDGKTLDEIKRKG